MAKRGFDGGHLAVVALAAVGFLLLCHLPLRGSDLWSHVIYGEWIAGHQALPGEDPTLELARGVPVTDGEWLSQLALAGVYKAAGGEGLSLLFALTVVATFLVLGAALARLSGSRLWGVVGALLALGVSWGRLGSLRPVSFAALGFALLIWVVVAGGAWAAAAGGGEGRWRGWVWLAVPLLLALWANLHGSYPVGVLLLLCLALGRAIELLREGRPLTKVPADAGLRRLVWLAELGLAATLVNPYGLDLWARTLSAASPHRTLEGGPLVVSGPGGREFALSIVVLILALRFGRRRVPAAAGLLLAALAAASLTGVQRLTWYGPVFALTVVPLLREIAHRWRAGKNGSAAGPDPWRRVWIAAALLLVWLAFALSPQGNRLLGGEPRPAVALYGADTPFGVTRFLRRRPPTTLTFAPRWWADWLTRHGAADFRPLVSRNIHLLSPLVWGDYLRVQAADASWDSVLAKYRVETAVVDKTRQARLAFQMRYHDEWAVAYEDVGAAVFVRRPVPSPVVGTAPPREETR